MKLSPKTVRSFQALWKSEFGEEISLEQAKKYANAVIGLAILFSKQGPSQEDQNVE